MIPRAPSPRKRKIAPRGATTSVVRIAALASMLAACDLQGTWLEAVWAEDARREALDNCCACLVNQTPETSERGVAVGDAGAETSGSGCGRCTCGTQAQCSGQLAEGASIRLLGACTQSEGPCEAACAGVLAYPAQSDAP